MPEENHYLVCEYRHPAMVVPASQRLFALPVSGLTGATRSMEFWLNFWKNHSDTGGKIPSHIVPWVLLDLPGVYFFYVKGDSAGRPLLMWDHGTWISIHQDLKKEFGWGDHAFGLKIYLKGMWNFREVDEIGKTLGLVIQYGRDGEFAYIEMHFDTEQQRSHSLDQMKKKFGAHRFGETMLFTE